MTTTTTTTRVTYRLDPVTGSRWYFCGDEAVTVVPTPGGYAVRHVIAPSSPYGQTYPNDAIVSSLRSFADARGIQADVEAFFARRIEAGYLRDVRCPDCGQGRDAHRAGGRSAGC